MCAAGISEGRFACSESLWLSFINSCVLLRTILKSKQISRKNLSFYFYLIESSIILNKHYLFTSKPHTCKTQIANSVVSKIFKTINNTIKKIQENGKSNFAKGLTPVSASKETPIFNCIHLNCSGI